MTSYITPFVALPPPFFIKNNKSALDHAEFAAHGINELLINKCTIEAFSRPYCCNPLSVAGGRKLRLVLDLSRSVNPFVRLNLNMKASSLSQSCLETFFVLYF